MHRIFQLHHIAPDEVYSKPLKTRLLMYASEILVMEEEEKERRRNKSAKR